MYLTGIINNQDKRLFAFRAFRFEATSLGLVDLRRMVAMGTREIHWQIFEKDRNDRREKCLSKDSLYVISWLEPYF